MQVNFSACWRRWEGELRTLLPRCPPWGQKPPTHGTEHPSCGRGQQGHRPAKAPGLRALGLGAEPVRPVRGEQDPRQRTCCERRARRRTAV